MEIFNLITDEMMKLSMLILAWTNRLSIFAGNNTISKLDKMGIPLMEKLNKYSSLPDEILISIVGYGILLLLIVLLMGTRERMKSTKDALRRIKNRKDPRIHK